MKKKHYIIIACIAIGILSLLFIPRKQSADNHLSTRAVKGNFTARVYSTGQLQTENSELIVLPKEMSSRNIDMYEIKVSNIVEEGTVVDSGGYVATLDHAAVEELRTKAQEELETSLNAYEDAKIDTNLNLSTLRDELLNADVDLEEKRLILEQSIYESPAVKRKAKLDVERSERDLEQKKRNYKLKQKQDEFKVYRAWEKVKVKQDKVNDIDKLFKVLEVKAPKPGLVIYSYDRFGKKIKAGSTISRWRPQIAELPDLSSMLSKTFINEIDISKVKVGQSVKVGIDAFPEKSFDGEVISVANIGQVIPEGDAKVFEVSVKIDGTDKDLRPAMTTSNIINTAYLEDIIYAPLECIFTNDSLSFVFIKEGGNAYRKQIVQLGISNENHVQLIDGVNESDELLMNTPTDADKKLFSGIEIYERELKAKADSLNNEPANI
ncbi:efflux RND transporter periplasmic adaptor subunit [Carboxylicivirga mesophila]|uniref:Efflux RND transporter periplasmic adaptor subunit n=1 Tax=Carboxylicivirga mesophila TaxID=1166478 RepID=A0ABS5K7V6_9BACT|nr:efflux RND transporter periplasmic adaptor subunit [Carboxylicivirga mesophila]MBS2211080.1 efflux RND transporter periplasmic adaptor subunit [Carboxylicivirga mesophila]